MPTKAKLSTQTGSGLRITGGARLGKKLILPQSADYIRPFPSVVRQALFNIVGPRIIGARVLDLYAGSGIIGLEALSRGAGFVQFVDDKSVPLIKLFCERCGFAGFSLTAQKAEAFVRSAPEPFDIVVMDPPYDDAHWTSVLTDMCSRNLLKEGGIAFLKVQKATTFALPEGMSHSSRRYGTTELVIIERSIGNG